MTKSLDTRFGLLESLSSHEINILIDCYITDYPASNYPSFILQPDELLHLESLGLIEYELMLGNDSDDLWSPNNQFFKHLLVVYPSHHKKMCDDSLPPWVRSEHREEFERIKYELIEYLKSL